MTTAYALALAEEINAQLDAVSVLALIEFHADKLQETGNTIKAFCPVHQDSRFRSLLIDSERRAFRCTIKTCQGYDGGSLVELYTLSKNVPYIAAAHTLAVKFKIEPEAGWQETLSQSYLEASEAARTAGDFTQASALLSELIGIMPSNVDARIKLASLQADLGDPQAAAEEYVQLIDYLVEEKKYDEAEATAESAIALSPDNEDILFARIRIAEEAGKHNLTIERMKDVIERREISGREMDNVGLLEQLVAKSPYEPEHALKLAALYEKQHNVRGASRQYENTAKLYLAAGNKSAGIEMLERVVHFNSENVRARLQLAEELANNNEMDKARDHTFRAINQQIDLQEFGTAVTTVNSWMEREPNCIDACELLARIYMDQDRAPEAATSLVEGADTAEKLGESSRAADLLLRAKFIVPDDIVIRRKLISSFHRINEPQRAGFEIADLAEILFSTEESDQARQLLEEGIRSGISISLKLQMITSLVNHNQQVAALENLKTISADASDSVTPDELAELYELQVKLEPGNYDHHRKLVETVWGTSPERAAAIAAESAEYFMGQDEPAMAESLLEIIASRLEGFVPAVPTLFDLAEKCERTDLLGALYQVSIQEFAETDAEQALRYARRLATLDPDHPSASSDIAFLLTSLGRTEDAAEQYARVALQLHGNGDFENAHQYAREAVELNPQSLNALACRTLTARNLLPPEEVETLASALLEQTRASSDPALASAGYLVYTELYPDNADVLAEAGTRLEQLGAVEGVARIKVRMASQHSIHGDWDKAAEMLSQATQSAPHLADIAEQLGEAQHILGKKDEAALAYSTAANSYVAAQDMETAQRCINNALNCQPENRTALEALFQVGETAGSATATLEAARKLTGLSRQEEDEATTARWAREWVRLSPAEADAHFALGKAQAAMQQPDHAANSFSTAASLFHSKQQFDKAVDALRQGEQLGSLGDQQREILASLLNESLDAPTRQAAQYLLGRSLVEEGALEKARGIANDLAAGERNDLAAELWPLVAAREINFIYAAQDYVHAAQANSETGKTASAISFLNTALNLSPANINAMDALTALLEQENQLAEALPHALNAIALDAPNLTTRLDRVRTVYGNVLEHRLGIARTLLNMGEPDIALEELETAARNAIDADDTNALIEICSLNENLTRRSTLLTQARADTLMGMENEEQAIDWIRTSARDLFADGKTADAINMAQKWVRLRSDDQNAHELLAQAYEFIGDSTEAARSRIRLANVLKSVNPTAALEETEKAVAMDGTSIPAFRLKIDILKSLGHDEQIVDNLLHLGNLETEAGNEANALAAYREILERKPGHPRALWMQADTLRGSNGIAAALPVYRQWLNAERPAVTDAQHANNIKTILEWAPANKQLLVELTDTLISSGQNQEAVSYLDQLSTLLQKEGDYRGAADALQRALAVTDSPTADQYITVGDLQEKAADTAAAIVNLRVASQILIENNQHSAASGVLEKVVALSGKTPLPEDLFALAEICSIADDKDHAVQYIDRALSLLPDKGNNLVLREKLITLGLDIAPLNSSYILQHMEILPAGRAMSEGIQWARKMNSLGMLDDSIRILSQLIALAPHDMSLRQELLLPLRGSGNTNRLRQELATLANDAATAGDNEAAFEAMDELSTLAETAGHYRQLAELNERLRRSDVAADFFTTAALAFAHDNKNDQAIAAINRAISAKPSAVSAESMAELVSLLRESVHDIAREQLRAALTARRQKQSQVIALSLLNTSTTERGIEVLKTVNSLGGSTFVVGIARQRFQELLNDNRHDDVNEMLDSLIAIASDSPDAWHLAAKIYNQIDERDRARRCALEAARLYQTIGAIIEEEDSYREAISATPGDFSIRVTLADYMVREGRPDDSIGILQEIIEDARVSNNTDLMLESLNRAVQIAPGNIDLREKLARELENIAPDSAITNWLETAKLYKESDHADRALKIYEHILQLHPANETALQEVLQDAYKTGNLSHCARYTKTLAEIKASRKNMGEACRLLQNYLEVDPHNLEILEKLSSLAGSSNNNEVFTTTTRALATRLQKMGNYEEALAQLEKLLLQNPRDMRLLMNMIDCCAGTEMGEKCNVYAHQLLAVAKENEDPEKIRFAANIIITHEPENASIYNDMGEALLSLNLVPEAVTQWLRAAELYEYSGNIAMAYTCYRRVTQVNPNTLQAWKKLADVSLTMGEPESAKMAVVQLIDKSALKADTRSTSLVERLLKALPDDPQVHNTALEYFKAAGNNELIVNETLWLAESALRSSNNEYAENIVESILAIVPGDTRLKAFHHNMIRQMGRIEELQIRLRQEAEQHEKAGRLDDAINLLKELVNLSPSQLSTHRELLRLYEKNKQQAEAFEQNLHIIRLLLDRSELEEARELSDDLASDYSKDFESRERIGDLYAQSAYPDAAARHYMAAAQTAKSKRKPEEHIRLLVKAVEARPSWIESRRALAEAYDKAGRVEQAFEAWIGLSSSMLEAGEYSEAASTLDMLTKQRPKSPEVREQLADLYERTGNRQKQALVLKDLIAIYETEENDEKTLAAYSKLIACQPDDSQMMTRYVELLTQNDSHTGELSGEYIRLADILTRQGDYEAAFQTYEQVIGLSPENTSVRSRYAAFLMNRGSRNRALTEMRTLADLYTKRNDYPAAIEVLNAALTISPRDADLCLTLAKAQEAAGFHEDARVSYARATAILASTAAVKGIDTYRRILSQDENNTAVRLRLVELLMKNDDKMEAAREARILAEIHLVHGQVNEAEYAYQLVDECQPESLEDIKNAIVRDSYNPSLQYVHYVRLGNRQMESGDIDAALDTYRTARSLHDDDPRLIQKCIECVSLIAPEAEAIPDYLLMAEKLLTTGKFAEAAKAYEHVRRIDPFNNDARCGLETVKSVERDQLSRGADNNDNLVLSAGRTVSKRVALMDLLVACQEASLDKAADDQKKLGH